MGWGGQWGSGGGARPGARALKPALNGSFLDTLQNTSYQFDTAGTNTVQLLVTTNNGCIDTLSKIIDVFPNPTDDVFNIRLGEEQTGQLQIRVLGTDGRVYLEQQVKNVQVGQTLQVNIEDLAAGVYFIELKMDEGTATRKLIVQK